MAGRRAWSGRRCCGSISAEQLYGQLASQRVVPLACRPSAARSLSKPVSLKSR